MANKYSKTDGTLIIQHPGDIIRTIDAGNGFIIKQVFNHYPYCRNQHTPSPIYRWELFKDEKIVATLRKLKDCQEMIRDWDSE